MLSFRYTLPLLLFFPALTFAFFCPTNFVQIDFGMTIEQVTEACGKPDSQNEFTKENDNVPQEWNYYVSQAVSTGNTYQEAQGTLKTSVVFNAEGKAINISVNGIGVGASQICGKTIRLGETRDEIKSACGDPAFINKQQSTPAPASASPPGTAAPIEGTKTVELIYSSAVPPTTLVFENGVLTAKK